MALGRALVADGYISQKVVKGTQTFSRMSYTTVSISPKGSKFLNDDSATIKLIPTKNMTLQKKQPEVLNIVAVASASGTLDISEKCPVREELLKVLIETRNEIATRLNLAPYMIFNEETLLQIAVRLI